MKLQRIYAAIFLPILLLSGISLTWLARHAVHQVVLEETANRARTQLQETADACVLGMEQRSEQVLLPLLGSALDRQGAVYAIALDDQGRVLAHTNVVEMGKSYKDPLSQKAMRAEKALFQEAFYKDRPVLDGSFPIWKKASPSESSPEAFILSVGEANQERVRLGTLRLGIPLDRALDTENQISRKLTLLCVIIGLVVLGLAILLLSTLLRPLQRFVRVSEEIAGGVYGTAVPTPFATELHQLAQSFNRMSQTLAQTTVSKDLLDSLLNHMLDPLILLHPDGRIRLVNAAARQLLGYGEGALLGQSPKAFIEDWDALSAIISQEGVIKNREILLHPQAGPLLSVLLSGSLYKGKDGLVAGVILAAKDLSERKKMEHEMLQSEKLAAVGKLAAGVAHEINNPLGTILGFAESLVFDLKPGDPLEMPLRSIERETLRCKHLVEDLLTFSRVSKVDRVAMNMNAAVESACNLIDAQARRQKIKVVKELAVDLPAVTANMNQMQQVIINLANNALDAMASGGTLTIRTSVSPDKARVLLAITDTGSGIPTDIISRIFEPFFTTKPVGKGTGLGLGLVHEIVEKHKGVVSVESQPGKTEFVVDLPAGAPPPEA